MSAQGALSLSEPVVVALTGAPAPLLVDGSPAPYGVAVLARRTVEIGRPRYGVRSYLAVAGGLLLSAFLAVQAVLAARCEVSGCTVHFVDNFYDHGPVILQRTVPVLPGDTPDSLAARVFAAEREALPEAINLIAAGKVAVRDGKVSQI